MCPWRNVTLCVCLSRTRARTDVEITTFITFRDLSYVVIRDFKDSQKPRTVPCPSHRAQHPPTERMNEFMRGHGEPETFVNSLYHLLPPKDK